MKKKIIQFVLVVCIGLAGITLIQKYQLVGRVIAAPALSTQPSEKMDKTLLPEISAFDKGTIGRGEYRRLVHMYGDSIARGRDGEAYPSPLNRIQDIANILLAENGYAPEELFVRCPYSQDIEKMRTELASGIIDDGDTIVYEDAGPHENDVIARRQRFQSIKRVVKESGRKVSLVFTTIFDYCGQACRGATEYDALIGTSGLTMNDVVRSATSDGFCSLWDWNKEMDEAVLKLGRFEVSPIYSDGIHPNVFGNLVLASSLLNHIGIPVKRYDMILDEFQKLLNNDNFIEKIRLDSQQLDELVDIIMKSALPAGV